VLLQQLTASRMIPIHPYYLGATPSAPINSAAFTRPQSMSQATLPTPSRNAGSPSPRAANRQSMPPPSRPAASPTSNTHPAASASRITEPTPEEAAEDSDSEDDGQSGRQRKGTMSRNFKFPTPSPEAPPPVPDILPAVPKYDSAAPASPRAVPAHAPSDTEEVALTPATAQSVEVPPPPPVEKERMPMADLGDEEVGDTEEISLN
jgi:chitin biosynthesis protein CHS5